MAEHCNVNDTGLSQYQQENKELGAWVIEKYFYDDFSIDTPRDQKMKNIELIISPRCNLGCRYCYLHRHRKKIFSEDCFNEERTIENLKTILQWYTHNDWNANIEIFSGELLAQEVGYKVLETIYEHFKDLEPLYRPREIVIPTNFTFVCSEEATARVKEIHAKLESIDICLGLSASFDGKYMEDNRPYLHDLDVDLGGGVRDDDYYERAFEFSNMIHGGLHPMVYSRNIDAWPQNFLWFQEMMEKHNIPWESLYLLHVRNEEWNYDQTKSLCKFMEFVLDWVWENKLDKDPYSMAGWLVKANGFNMFSQPLTTCGRGLTCGIQSQFTLRVSDLMMYPCHRTGYEDMYYGKLIPDKDEILKFECINPELLIATYSMHKSSLPHCAQCPINELCTGTCLGAQYECTRNLIAPIPTVCAVAHAMIYTEMKWLKDHGVWSIIWRDLSEEKKVQFTYLEEVTELNANGNS